MSQRETFPPPGTHVLFYDEDRQIQVLGIVTTHTCSHDFEHPDGVLVRGDNGVPYEFGINHLFLLTWNKGEEQE